MKQDESQDCLKPSYVPLLYDLCLGKVDAVRRWPTEIKSQTITILDSINTLYVFNTIYISKKK